MGQHQWSTDEGREVLAYIRDVWPGEPNEAENDIFTRALSAYPRKICKRAITDIRLGQESNFRPAPKTISDRCAEIRRGQTAAAAKSEEQPAEPWTGERETEWKRSVGNLRESMRMADEARPAVVRDDRWLGSQIRSGVRAAEVPTELVEVIVTARIPKSEHPRMKSLCFVHSKRRACWHLRCPRHHLDDLKRMLRELMPPVGCDVSDVEEPF